MGKLDGIWQLSPKTGSPIDRKNGYAQRENIRPGLDAGRRPGVDKQASKQARIRLRCVIV